MLQSCFSRIVKVVEVGPRDGLQNIIARDTEKYFYLILKKKSQLTYIQ